MRTVTKPEVEGANRHDELALRRLAGLIKTHAPQDGAFPLALPGLFAARRSRVSRTPTPSSVGPALCVVAQGAKVFMLGRETYEYNPARMIVFSVDLPVITQVTKATQARPYLSVRLNLDPYKVAELAMKVHPHGVPKVASDRGLYMEDSSGAIIDAFARLLELMARPADSALLAPLVVDEILIRLLRSPAGGRLAQIGRSDSGLRHVAPAVAWVRTNFADPLSVEQLARLANMSVSSFHQRFKAVTSMSPLQYQKVLRLHEARRLVLFQAVDVGAASRQVGYVSASQFSREYARLFGRAPTKDIARLRAEGQGS
jgi:AraC-like DNA-binding protein